VQTKKGEAAVGHEGSHGITTPRGFPGLCVLCKGRESEQRAPTKHNEQGLEHILPELLGHSLSPVSQPMSMTKTVACNRSGMILSRLCVVASFLALVGCGGGGSGSQLPPPPPPEIFSVTVSPETAQLFTSKGQLFTAKVTGSGAFNPGVSWSVNGISGGNSTVGTIVGGQYIAPTTSPNPSPGTVTIEATSVEDSTVFGSAVVTVCFFSLN